MSVENIRSYGSTVAEIVRAVTCGTSGNIMLLGAASGLICSADIMISGMPPASLATPYLNHNEWPLFWITSSLFGYNVMEAVHKSFENFFSRFLFRQNLPPLVFKIVTASAYAPLAIVTAFKIASSVVSPTADTATPTAMIEKPYRSTQIMYFENSPPRRPHP